MIKTARPMELMGHSFKKGDVVPGEVLAEIPEGRYRSLTNVGLLREFPDEVQEAPTQAPEPEPVAEPAGDLCPQCGEGPFKRLDRHMTKHEGA